MLVYFQKNGGTPMPVDVHNRGIAINNAKEMSKKVGKVRIAYNREMIGAITFENGTSCN